MMPRLAGNSALAASILVLSQPVLAAWMVEEKVAPLTGDRSIAVFLDSSNTLQNAIGDPANARLVIRCAEGQFVAYVAWPEVLQYQLSTMMAGPQTMAWWRIDQQPVKVDFWTLGSNYDAAGEFASRSALKLVGTFLDARQLVVRMQGRVAQDAIFDLAGLQEVAPKVAASCGLAFKRAR